MLAVIYHVAATNVGLRTLPVTLLGSDPHLSSTESRITPHAPVAITNFSSWCALQLSDLMSPLVIR